MTIRRTNKSTEFHVGQIVMTSGVITYGFCGWPCTIIAVNKTRLTLERLRTSILDERDRKVLKYAPSILYIADTEEEAFEFHTLGTQHAKRAAERLAALNREIRAEGTDLMGRFGIKAGDTQ